MSLNRILALAALLAAGYALTLVVMYPGYMTNDAVFVYEYAREGRYGDWQSPMMSILWRAIDPIAPGPGSMFLVIATLYWLGFAAAAAAVARRAPGLALWVPVMALVPPAFMLLGMIWRDVLFGAVWLLAAALAFAVADRGAAVRRSAQAIALALVAFGVLLRPNAIFAAAILAVYVVWPARFSFRHAALWFVPAAAAGLALVHLTYYGLLGVKREHPLHSLYVFDLGGITHFTGENQFPVVFSAKETALLTTQCYNPRYWDAYWTLEPCRFVMQRLERKDDVVFGSPRLAAAWRHALRMQPTAYLQHRAAFTLQFLAGANLTLEPYGIDDPKRTPLAQHRPFRALLALHALLKETPLFLTGTWLLLAILVVAFAWRRRATPAGAFAVGVATSGVVYAATFFVFGVAADFRYGYWLVLASVTGMVAAFAARREGA